MFQKPAPLALCLRFCQAAGDEITSDPPAKSGGLLQSLARLLVLR